MFVHFYDYKLFHNALSAYKRKSIEQSEYLVNAYPNKKVIVINLGDEIFSDTDKIFENPNIVAVIDHHKKNNSNKDNYQNKIICLLNYGSIYKRLFRSDILPIIEREYDIVFLGGMTYNESITKHRKDVVDNMLQFCEKYGYRTYIPKNGSHLVGQRDFHNIILNTKIFVSPYGWVEWSTKDYECICLGCHVIVPNEHLSSYPNHYEYFDSFELDFSDFEQKLLFLLNNLDIVQEKVNNARRIFNSFKNYNQVSDLEDKLFHSTTNA